MRIKCLLFRNSKVINKITDRNYSDILTKVALEDGIQKITMCHTKTRNSLSIDMMTNLIKNIEECENDRKVRVVVLAAEGPIFSAGHNLKELSADKSLEPQVFNLATKLMAKIIDSPVPIIAKVEGLAAAAGCQLVAQCDLAFCTQDSQFSTPGANFGIFCSTPGIALARSVPKSMALKMLLTGVPISSQDAKIQGLVTEVCANSESLELEIRKSCDAIKSKSRDVIELGKKFYYKQITERDVKRAYELGGNKMVENLQMDDGQEGIRSFVEKRKPQWK